MMNTQRQRVGGSDANPIYRIDEQTRGGELAKFVVGETGVAFDTLEAAEAAARDMDTLGS
jgi:hypothetical protein